MTQQTEQICFRYDGSEEAKKALKWVNEKFNRDWSRVSGDHFSNNGDFIMKVRDFATHRLVTPAEFLRLVCEPQWKVGDECEFIDCGSHIGVIVAIKDNWIWVQGKDHHHPRTVGVDDLRPIRKSVREEIANILMMPFFTADQILDIIKQRKDEL